jgi:hypothetical protein
MKEMHRIDFSTVLGVILVAALLAGCGSRGAVSELIAPAQVLALAGAPPLPTGAEVVHVQWVYEELEGFPPNADQPQFTRTTTDMWAEMATPWRYRSVTTVEPAPGEIAYAWGWNGESLWEYNVETDARHAVVRPPAEGERPSGPLEVARFANPYPDLLAQVQGSPDRLRDLGTEELTGWGTVRVIAYDWEGVTAATVRYRNRPHTLLFKVTEKEHWLVEWLDVIHAEEGDVIHRHHRLTAWESLDPSAAPADLWAFVLPEGVTVVESLPEATPTVESLPEATPVIVELPEQKTWTIGRWTVPDYGYTPWMPTYLPEGMALAQVEAQDEYYHYTVRYEWNGRSPLMIFQSPRLASVGWGGPPEIIKLSWGEVELGEQDDPMASPGWVAFVRPHRQGNEVLPNLSLLLEIADRDLMLRIVESLQPMSE